MQFLVEDVAPSKFSAILGRFVVCSFVSHVRGMGKKFLEDNLSQAVWGTILRALYTFMATWNEAEFFIRSNKGCSPPPSLSRRTCFRGPCLGASFGAALQVLWEDSPEGQPIKEVLKKATRFMSRVAGKKIRFDSEKRSSARIEKIFSSRSHTRTASSAASIGESATVARRSSQQCSRSFSTAAHGLKW